MPKLSISTADALVAERPAASVTEAVKLTGKPTPRATESLSMRPFFYAHCRDVGAYGRAVDAGATDLLEKVSSTRRI